LKGKISSHRELDIGKIRDEVNKDCELICIKNMTELEYDTEELEKEHSLKGLFTNSI